MLFVSLASACRQVPVQTAVAATRTPFSWSLPATSEPATALDMTEIVQSDANQAPSPALASVDADTQAMAAVRVPRHGIDLPTFLDALATELTEDARITLISSAIDGNLRDDGIPAGVIEFRVRTGVNDEAVSGWQYVFAMLDVDEFLVLTCLGNDNTRTRCSERARTESLADQR